MKNQSRKTYATINLPALLSNYIRSASLAPSSKTIAVIKANAYGHGAIEIAKYLSPHVPAFAVAFIDEAIELREAGITLPILIFEGPLSYEDFSIAAQQNFWLMLHTTEQVSSLNKLPVPYTEKLWLKVDTGMHRLGIKPSNINKVLTEFTPEQLQDLVLCTHFSNADEIENPKTLSQIETFERMKKSNGYKSSLANSAGILAWPQSHSDYNRLGIALYGATPIPVTKLPIKLAAVMTLRSTVIALREIDINESVGYGDTWQAKRPTVIATVAIGYADGYPRSARNGTPVFIKGQIAPLVGRVSMDMITIDVTDIIDIEIGDDVELWGENLAIEIVAEHLNSNNYELLTRISNRVPRVYVK